MTHLHVILSQFRDEHMLPVHDFNIITWPAGRTMAQHCHDFLQIIHCLHGTLEIDMGNGWVPLLPQQVHVLHPGLDHALRSPQGMQQFGINCMPEAHPLSDQLIQACTVPHIVPLLMPKQRLSDL